MTTSDYHAGNIGWAAQQTA